MENRNMHTYMKPFKIFVCFSSSVCILYDIIFFPVHYVKCTLLNFTKGEDNDLL